MEGHFEVRTEWGARFTAFGRVPFRIGDKVAAAVRPEGIRLQAQGGAEAWRGVVETAQFLGEAVEYRVKIANQVLRARCDRSQPFAAGDAVVIELRDQACTILAD